MQIICEHTVWKWVKKQTNRPNLPADNKFIAFNCKYSHFLNKNSTEILIMAIPTSLPLSVLFRVPPDCEEDSHISKDSHYNLYFIAI